MSLRNPGPATAIPLKTRYLKVGTYRFYYFSRFQKYVDTPPLFLDSIIHSHQRHHPFVWSDSALLCPRGRSHSWTDGDTTLERDGDRAGEIVDDSVEVCGWVVAAGEILIISFSG